MFILNKGQTLDIVVHDVMVGMTKTTNKELKHEQGLLKGRGRSRNYKRCRFQGLERRKLRNKISHWVKYPTFNFQK